MKTISILASGPPKKGRNRHLEIFNGKPCITHVIDNCQVGNVKISVIISNKNKALREYLKKTHNNVKILETYDNSMLTTYKTAFYEDDNDKILVDGDLINLKKENVIKFLNSEYRCALSLLKYPWGADLISNDRTLIRRGDIGGSLLLIGYEYQKEYISDKNIHKAKEYFNNFYPTKEFNINLANHLDTWMKYVLFFNIASNKNVNSIGKDIGLIYVEDKIWLDND
jgi:GTP:adenosylcobinamide-phosphate guanylyltransferase